MKKFNRWEYNSIVQGLDLVKHHCKVKIEEVEAQGKVAIFSVGYIDRMIDEIKIKAENFTKQERKCKPKV